MLYIHIKYGFALQGSLCEKIGRPCKGLMLTKFYIIVPVEPTT